MIRRFSNRTSRSRVEAATTGQAQDIREDLYPQEVKEALVDGVQAMADPDIAKKVNAYFRDNPGCNRDAVHVAAVACQFRREKVLAGRPKRQKTCFQSRPG